jgi:hypothetical protein
MIRLQMAEKPWLSDSSESSIAWALVRVQVGNGICRLPSCSNRAFFGPEQNLASLASDSNSNEVHDTKITKANVSHSSLSSVLRAAATIEDFEGAMENRSIEAFGFSGYLITHVEYPGFPNGGSGCGELPQLAFAYVM